MLLEKKRLQGLRRCSRYGAKVVEPRQVHLDELDSVVADAGATQSVRQSARGGDFGRLVAFQLTQAAQRVRQRPREAS